MLEGPRGKEIECATEAESDSRECYAAGSDWGVGEMEKETSRGRKKVARVCLCMRICVCVCVCVGTMQSCDEAHTITVSETDNTDSDKNDGK